MASSYQAQLRRIKREIEKLQIQRDALMLKERKSIIKKIIGAMAMLDIAPEDIEAAYEKTPLHEAIEPGTGSKTGRRTLPPVQPKYRNPATGDTWSGRGRAPRWITEAEANGTPKAEYLISKTEHRQVEGAET